MTLINSRYKINQTLGEGQFTAVYHANDLSLRRKVALKIVRNRYCHAFIICKLLAYEAGNLYRFRYPAIPLIHDFGHYYGRPYFVMEYMPGGSLQARLEKSGAIPPNEAGPIIMRLAQTLDYVHERGIVHRHLKSDSILFDNQDSPYLSNFFIAYHEASKENFAEFTVVGPPHAIAPEQWQWQTPTNYADIYQLGVLAFEMLTGKRPFHADSLSEYRTAHLQQPPPSLTVYKPDLPPACDAVFQKALAKEPSQRFATTVDFAQALNEAFYH